MERGSKWPKKSPLNQVLLPPRFRTLFLVLNSHVGVWILLDLSTELDSEKKDNKRLRDYVADLEGQLAVIHGKYQAEIRQV